VSTARAGARWIRGRAGGGLLAPHDGGLVLLGLARPAPTFLPELTRHGAEALAAGLARARAAGLRVAALQPLDRVVTPGDLLRLVVEIVVVRGAPPTHTTAVLRDLGLAP
jgi:hypothetical protein